MFEAAEVGAKLSKKTYAEKVPSIREALLDAQFRLQNAGFSAIVVIAGAEAAGKGETVNCLLDWLDARGVEAHAIDKPSDEELKYPRFFRFWRRLPGHGRMAVFFGSWYTRPIISHIAERMDEATFEKSMRQIVEFERMLVNENTLLIKFWLHITKKQQRKTLKRLEADPDTAWRVTDKDWEFNKTYDQFLEVARKSIRLTSSGHAPWTLVEASDKRFRHITVAEKILVEVTRHLDAIDAAQIQASPSQTPKPQVSDDISPRDDSPPPGHERQARGGPEGRESTTDPGPPLPNIINTLQLDQPLTREDYEKELTRLQSQLGQLARRMTDGNLAASLVFEGSDGAGKGGCIRRIAHALDARFYRVVPICAPSDEERIRPYLWRFWRTIPRRGHITIYDRSWYGRVLVERVEQLCSRDDWQRAYSEINEFEQQQADHGVLVIKFWLAISKDEQLARFRLREQTGYKRYKLTDEDWRNREKWDENEQAAAEMIARTSTQTAPWTLVEANNKLHARIKTLRTVCQRLEQALS